MALFARINGTTVTDIHVLANGVTDNLPFPESEPLGQTFLADLWGDTPESYVQCSYDGAYRGCYPGMGYTFDGSVFVPPASEEI